MKHSFALGVCAAILFAAVGHADAQHVLVPGGSFVEICPGHKGSGDKNFAGHGPWVEAVLILKTDPTQRKLQIQLVGYMRETVADWTYGDVDRTITIYEAPAGKKLASIWIVPAENQLVRTVPITGPGNIQIWYMNFETNGTHTFSPWPTWLGTLKVYGEAKVRSQDLLSPGESCFPPNNSAGWYYTIPELRLVLQNG